MLKDGQFVPNTSVMKRILGILVGESIGRTRLSQKANVHYNILKSYLSWLEERQFIEYAIVDGKTLVRLRQQGRVFAVKFSDLYQ